MMDSNAEVQEALLAIHSRLGTIEGKVNLVARADREKLMAVLDQAIRENPLLGQIYLLLDGHKTQQDILIGLEESGISASQATISRRMDDLVAEYGVADVIQDRPKRILKKNKAAEDILNLTRKVRRILAEVGVTDPESSGR